MEHAKDEAHRARERSRIALFEAHGIAWRQGDFVAEHGRIRRWSAVPEPVSLFRFLSTLPVPSSPRPPVSASSPP